MSGVMSVRTVTLRMGIVRPSCGVGAALGW